ncbi:MAG TPA: aldehyde reductase [Vicinamibacterales bacterium]
MGDAGGSGDLVLVTGARGFIAKHVIREALARGYRVRGTIRRPEAEAEVRAAVGEPGPRLSFVHAELLADEGWAEAVQGCRYVLHVASAFPLVAPVERDALVPVARDGTLRVLRAAADTGVERTVLTSSCAAIWAGHPPDPTRVLTEADWAITDSPRTDSYSRSKALAERAAWNFLHGTPTSMSLVSINPSFVMGPPLDRGVQSSADLVLMFLRGRYPLVPNWGVEIADVRDVAAAHLAALETPAAAGRRFIVSDGPLMLADMARILGREFPQFRKKMPKGSLPDFVTRLLGRIDSGVRQLVPDLGPPKRTSSQAAREVLGIRCRPAEEALIAMARRVIELGMV